MGGGGDGGDLSRIRPIVIPSFIQIPDLFKVGSERVNLLKLKKGNLNIKKLSSI